MALSRRKSSPNETKANFPHTNVGGFTVVPTSGWELNELTQPRLKLAVEKQLVGGKKGQIPPTGAEAGTGDRGLPWSLWDSASPLPGLCLLAAWERWAFVAVSKKMITTEGVAVSCE